jgi:hypothetical protein
MNGDKPRQYIMEHGQMDFETQVILGGCHYGAADAGEILAAVERIPGGISKTGTVSGSKPPNGWRGSPPPVFLPDTRCPREGLF